MPHVFPDDHGRYRCSHQRNGLEMYGGPMKVTVLNTSTATAKLFTAVVPQNRSPWKNLASQMDGKGLEPIWLLQKGYADIPE